jgi:hypothetical protein
MAKFGTVTFFRSLVHEFAKVFMAKKVTVPNFAVVSAILPGPAKFLDLPPLPRVKVAEETRSRNHGSV